MGSDQGYLRESLRTGKLKGDYRRRATDSYWSLRVFKIKRVIIGRNPPQPVLYYLKNKPIESTVYLIGQNPKRPFKYEELQVIEEPDKIEYLFNKFMRKYYHTGFIHFSQITDNMLIKAHEYASRRGQIDLDEQKMHD
ncbi:9852_t:CDS:2 [Funneliformis geosporum]|uniref:9852_t:CDS:1 n=1 Tax=Funneliformis geosporum TaxID=1117311 RepID=A0A9W4T1P9_9GLOM|nr:9852_t:CDS:2 [Funneliformis geosporum]